MRRAGASSPRRPQARPPTRRTPHRKGRRVRKSRRTRRTPKILAPPAEARETTMSMMDTKTRKPSSTFQLLRRYACSPKYRPSETTWGRGEGPGHLTQPQRWGEGESGRWGGAAGVTCPMGHSEGGWQAGPGRSGRMKQPHSLSWSALPSHLQTQFQAARSGKRPPPPAGPPLHWKHFAALAFLAGCDVLESRIWLTPTPPPPRHTSPVLVPGGGGSWATVECC